MSAPSAMVKSPTPRRQRIFLKLSERWGRPTRMAATPEGLHIAVWEDPLGAAVAFNTLGLSEMAHAADGVPVELHWLIKQPLNRAEQAAAMGFLAQVAAAQAPGAQFDWHGRVRAPNGIPGFPRCFDLWLHPALTEADPDLIEDQAAVIRLLYIIPLTEYEHFALVRHGVAALLQYIENKQIDLLSPRWIAN